jgi:RNA polymerase primary sigma factor
VLIDNQSIDPLNELISNNEEVSSKINGILHGLDKREQLIIRKYFGLGCETETLDKIGEELKCSKERVRQLKDVALKKIRNDSYSLLKFLS